MIPLAYAFALSIGATSPDPTVLRHLEFSTKVKYRLGIQTRQHGYGATETGTPNYAFGDNANAEGTITVDVLKALTDGSLVTRISEDSPVRGSPPIEVGITATGELMISAESAKALLPEQRLALMLLARKTIVGHELSVGNTWDIVGGARDTRSKTTFQVSSVDPTRTDRINVRVDGSTESTNTEGLSGTFSGTMLYDAQMDVPVRAAFDITSVEDGTDQRSRLEMTVSYELKQDTLAH